MPNEIPVVFHKDSNYDYHFIIKELANEFEVKLESLGKNQEKYKTFSVPTEMEVIKIIKVIKFITISCKIKFADSARSRFMATWSNLVDNLAEGFHKIKCKDYDYLLQYERFRGNSININAYLAV